jgi:hypothetical protein
VRSQADGKPVEEYSIRWAARESAGNWTERESGTIRDPRGLCELEDLLPTTTYWILVTAAGLGSATLEAVATEEGAGFAVLLPPLGALDLHVTRNGAPAAYAHVSASRAQSPLESALRGEWGASGRTNEHGDKQWSALDPGTWTLTISHGDRVTHRLVEIPAGEVPCLEVDLP